MIGALAALASSFTWAFASTRYAQASRGAGSVRVNLARAVIVFPIYAAVSLAVFSRGAFAAVSAPKVAWLAASVLCSYGFADNLFFAASRRIGVSTALAICSTYPLWATLAGVALGGERFGWIRLGGTLLCVGGVAALILLAPASLGGGRGGRRDLLGLALSVVTSLLWALNTVAIKRGGAGVSAWEANAIRYGIALVFLFASLAATGFAPGPGGGRAPSGGWRSIVPAVFADALVGSMCFVYGLTHTDIAVGATLTSLAPLISVPFAILLGEERWSAARTAAIAATVAGVVVLVAMS